MLKETSTGFCIHVTSLFTKAGINEFNAKRAYILGTLNEDMKCQIIRPLMELEWHGTSYEKKRTTLYLDRSTS
jgi:hypothetical protein